YIFLSIIFFLSLAFLAILSFITTASACDHEDVYLVDLEECAAMHKIIGTHYQCMDEIKDGYKLYDRGREESAYLLTKDNVQFIVMEVEGRDMLGALKND
ncbi:MAG: hypothetical protein IJU76_15415, partial [Desulfovibrionaceae bacterium]|nr:hypothetical protein [Desulfovibrionaceae bacterium]